MADSNDQSTNLESNIDFKQLRSNGDKLLEVYKSKDLLENEKVKETRNKLIDECEEILIGNSYAGKIVDVIWKYCWYEAISAFKAQHKRFSSNELNSLQKFIHNGIEYFEDLGTRIQYTKYRCLLYKGDLLRYEHKMIKTDESVLLKAEKCYQQAVDLDPKLGTSYSKLATIYESKNPQIALIFLLRSIINKTTPAVSSLLKLNVKNVPSGFVNIFNLTQNAFQVPSDNFQSSLESFKQFMDDNNSSMSASVLIQNLHTASLLAIAIENLENKNEEMLKSLIVVICQYFNLYVPILIDQLSKSEILQQRRNCASPIEEDGFGDLNEAFNYLGIEPEATLYENVLYPTIPLLLTLNEFVAYLFTRLPSLKLSVGSRMVCQSVLYKFPDLLNCFIDVFGYRVEENPNDFQRASKWLFTHLFALKKSQAFGVLIDSLKQSIFSTNHPLDFDGKFKYDQSKKEGKKKKFIQKMENNFITPDFLVTSSESWYNHWSKLIFLLDNLKNSKALITSNALKHLEKRADMNFEYKKSLENIERLVEQSQLIVYNEEIANCIQLVEMILEKDSDGKKQIALIVENTEFLNERSVLSKNVSCCSALELYDQFCNSTNLNPNQNILPFLKSAK